MQHAQKEIAMCNEKKHKAKVGVTNIKNKMLKDMEEFSRELNVAKLSISSAQTNILSAMREKMMTAQISPSKFGATFDKTSRISSAATGAGGGDEGENKSDTVTQAELAVLLQDTGLTSVEELILALEASEEQVFVLYSETQQKEDEMEKIDVDNKHLEQQVELQVSK